MKQFRTLNSKLLMVAATFGVMSHCFAATVFWNNTGTGNWNDPANWGAGTAIPTPGDDARIANGGTAIIDDAQAVTTGFAHMGDTAGTSGSLQMTGGKLTNSFDIRVGGSSLTAGGTGLLDQSGGVIFMNGGNLNVGYGVGSIGTYNLSGGSIQVNSGTIFAVANRARATVNQSSGTIYVRGFSVPGTSVTQLGRNTAAIPASGTYNLSGGTLATAQLQYGNAVGGAGSSNVFNLSGTGTAHYAWYYRPQHWRLQQLQLHRRRPHCH